MDATLPVDLRRFRPVVETVFRKIQHPQEKEMDERMGDSPYVAITATSKLSPPLAATAAPEESGPTVTAAVTVTAAAARSDHPQQQQQQQQQIQTQHRSLKFSVENILDPNKFTGHNPLVPPPRINNNIFQPHLHPHHPHPLFHHAHHPWLHLPVNPANLLHHHQQQIQHHMDVHSTSVESEDSLYDRSSDLESGLFHYFQLYWANQHFGALSHVPL